MSILEKNARTKSVEIITYVLDWAVETYKYGEEYPQSPSHNLDFCTIISTDWTKIQENIVLANYVLEELEFPFKLALKDRNKIVKVKAAWV